MHTTNDKALKLATGHWWRFDKYEIRGSYIGPAKGAKLRTYDPWDEDEEMPYRSLVSLTEELGITTDVLTRAPAFWYRPWVEKSQRHPPLVADAEALILRWCRKYGLLGMLLHQAREVTFVWRWDYRRRPREPNPDSTQELYPTIYRHIRQVGRWETTWFQAARPTLDDPKRQGQAANVPGHPPPWIPSVVWEDFHNGSIGTTSLDACWAPFFPDVPSHQAATYSYPKPLSDKFWQLYAEHISAFISGALALRYALWCIDHRKPSRVMKDNKTRVEQGAHIIQGLVSPVSPIIGLSKDGVIQQKWSSPSLIGSFAMMAMQDLAKDRLRLCNACGTFFTSDAYQVLYCSDTCRRTEQQRRYRKRKVKKTMMQAKKRTKKRSALS